MRSPLRSALMALLLATVPAAALAQALPAPKVVTRPANDNSDLAASTRYVDTSAQILLNAISGKAPIANPTFDGTTTLKGPITCASGSVCDASPLSVTGQGRSRSRASSSRAADYFDPKDYGAFGDGVAHTVQGTLGISTLAGLAAYAANGVQPYSWVNSYPYGTLFNLPLSGPATAGSTTLSFGATATVGSLIPTVSTAASGATSVNVSDKTMTADGTQVVAGTPVSGLGIVPGTTVTGVSGNSGSWVFALSTAASAPVPNGTLLAFSVSPIAGVWSLPVVSTSGIHQGMTVTGAGIPVGTQVENSNPSRLEIQLSKATTAPMGAGQVLTFVQSWLANVRVGMQVSGSGIAPGTTVTGVDAAGGTVTLSAPTTASMTAQTAMTGVASPVGRSSTITFYAPFTDAEAAALEMDTLGLQAAEKAAEAAGGGTVRAAPGDYRLSFPIVFPVASASGYTLNTVSLSGDLHDRNAVRLRATKDFGPGNAAISCADPTAKFDNARGLYQGTGYFCMGQWANFYLVMDGYAFPGAGLRPTKGGIPVAMDGLKHGPRRDMKDVLVLGFNNGVLTVQDHTRWQDVVFQNNYNGIRLDQQQVNLGGDEVWDRVYSSKNAWAAVSIDADVLLNGQINKPYWGYQPFAVHLEPGPTAGQGLQGLTITNPNFEGNSVGVIKDGSIRDGNFAVGAMRTAQNVKIQTPYFGPILAGGPKSGQAWTAYIDLFGAYGLEIENIFDNTFGSMPSNQTLIRLQRADAGVAVGRGGVRLAGGGLWTVIQSTVGTGIQLVAGAGALNNTFVSTGSFNYVDLEGANWKAKLLPISDAGLTAGLPNGTLLEYGTTAISGGSQATAQRAGLGTNRPLVGVSIQPWGSNPTGLRLTAVAVAGSRLPILTTATAGAGTLLKASTATPGSADVATGTGDGTTAGIVTTGINASSAYMKTLFPGGY